MKTFLIILGSLLAIILIIPVFVDDDVKVIRSIEVKAPVEIVYNIVKDFNYYKQWNAWSKMDTDASGEISGSAGEVGSSWNWDGDTVGKGNLTIEVLEPNKSITSKLVFISPMEGVAQDLWDFEIIDSTSTKITWTYAGTATSYFARYMNLAMDGFLGPQLELGLSNLKELIENIPEPVKVEEEVME